MEKYITDERTGFQYELVGDYYLLAGEDEPEVHSPIGIWGKKHSIGVTKQRILQEIKNRKRFFTRIRGKIQSKIHFSNTESIVGLNEKF